MVKIMIFGSSVLDTVLSWLVVFKQFKGICIISICKLLVIDEMVILHFCCFLQFDVLYINVFQWELP